MQDAHNPQDESLAKLNAFADEAKALVKEAHQRHLEVRAGFYEKLAALDAGSIAVTVSLGVAVVGHLWPWHLRSHPCFGWLVALAFFLWISLICSFAYNVINVEVLRLEATVAREASAAQASIRTVLIAHQRGTKLLLDGVDGLVKEYGNHLKNTAKKSFSVRRWVKRGMVIGYVATISFLAAYSLAFACLVRIWWLAR